MKYIKYSQFNNEKCFDISRNESSIINQAAVDDLIAYIYIYIYLLLDTTVVMSQKESWRLNQIMVNSPRNIFLSLKL